MNWSANNPYLNLNVNGMTINEVYLVDPSGSSEPIRLSYPGTVPDSKDTHTPRPEPEAGNLELLIG